MVDVRRRIARQKLAEGIFKVAAIGALIIAIGSLAILLIDIFSDGLGRVNWQFLTSFPSRKPEQAGILSALVGTASIMVLTGFFAFPIGVGAAVYLEEYGRKGWFARLVEVNIANLAGVPSVLYGLLGLELFVRMAGFGRSLLAGGLTMALLVLPIVIIASREALKTVPPSIREASYALGGSRWQTIWHQVLPMAFPGILTGCILAFSRAIGEAAPMITIGALAYIAFLPSSVTDSFTVMPIQIFNWVSRPQKGFFECAAAAIVVLLAVLLLMNAVAIFLRHRYQKKVYL
ncbi:MAG: phosphate ABC transporter permease PstA [Candidatus Omnitrophica bacterium]|nr:phosphate ABC transporter permease PstA [Candidatus Omnitrophota bacterium]